MRALVVPIAAFVSVLVVVVRIALVAARSLSWVRVSATGRLAWGRLAARHRRLVDLCYHAFA